MTPVQLRNLVRGGRGFHSNRFAILRACLTGKYPGAELSEYLGARLFKLPDSGWTAFAFTRKDWEIAQHLVDPHKPSVEHTLLSLAVAYVKANLEAVAKLYAMSDAISGRLLGIEAVELAPGTDLFSNTEAHSLFAFRVVCGTHQAAPQTMRDELERSFQRSGWCHTRLMYPLINLVIHGRSADDLDEFLAYFATGDELPVEMLALKLLLSDTAARHAPLSFKLFVGLMGHPFDVCELLLDHIEYASLSGAALSTPLLRMLDSLRALLPSTRVERVARSGEALRVLIRVALDIGVPFDLVF